jgi:hypothetical protein
VGGGRMDKRDLAEGVWLTDLMYLYEIEQRNFLQYFKWDEEESRGRDGRVIWPVYNISLYGNVTMNDMSQT